MFKNDYEQAKENVKLDIFSHLNLNIKNPDFNCKCQNSTFPHYCIQCKKSVCEQCGLKDHNKHNPIDKSKFILTNENIEDDFAPAVKYLEEHPIFANFMPIKEKLLKQVEENILKLNEEVSRFRERKLRQIERKFNSFNNCIKAIKDGIEVSQKNTKIFADKYKYFFNLNFFNNPEIKTGNRDQLNTVFFLSYDLLSQIRLKSFQIQECLQKVDTQINLFEKNEADEFNELSGRIHNELFPPELEDSQNLNNYDLDSPTYLFFTYCKKLEDINFKNINERISKYTYQIEAFKKTVFNILGRTGSMKELEREVTAIESRRQTGVDNLFSKRQQTLLTMDGNENDKIIVQGKLETTHFTPHVNKKDDVILNHILIQKYFSYNICQLYGDNFRLHTKELQSSHADLMVKLDDFEGVGKVIEGTNEIWFIEKKNSKNVIIKKSIKLTKNPHGYTKFPLGCRTLLVGRKLYITGGVDETGEYCNVLIYDRKTERIKRIIDLNEPRSYHAIFYDKIFSTLLVVGGVNKSSVEIFDPVTNRWQFLPSLIYPRANAYYHMDEARGLIYVLFGQDGISINENSYNETVEYLDLTQIKQGWFKFEYSNKANVHLRSYLTLEKINNELLLIVGGVTSRKSSRTVCVLDFSKKQILKIDKKLMEIIRQESKKSKKLSYIISSMSLNFK